MLGSALNVLVQRLDNAARLSGRPRPVLLAVCKGQPAEAVAELAGAGQRDFGDNYVLSDGYMGDTGIRMPYGYEGFWVAPGFSTA